MRLIDADKIRYRDMSDGRVVNGVWYTFMEDIDEMPTVKAIPIEWLEAWWKKHSEEYSSGIDGWYEVEGFYPNIFNELLIAWVEENE